MQLFFPSCDCGDLLARVDSSLPCCCRGYNNSNANLGTQTWLFYLQTCEMLAAGITWSGGAKQTNFQHCCPSPI